MSGRGTQNGPNTRNPERPARQPARLDQYADDRARALVEFGIDQGVTDRKEARNLRKFSRKKDQ